MTEAAGIQPGTHEWTGFVVVLVPTVRVTIDPDEVVRRVRARVAGDVTLCDVVTIGRSAPVGDCDERDAVKVARALLDSAFVAGTVFAPRLVFGCVVVDGSQEDALRSANLLAASRALSLLPVHFHGAAPPAGEEVSDQPPPPLTDQFMTEILARTAGVIQSFERWPEFVIGEDQLATQRLAFEGKAPGRRPRPHRQSAADHDGQSVARPPAAPEPSSVGGRELVPAEAAHPPPAATLPPHRAPPPEAGIPWHRVPVADVTAAWRRVVGHIAELRRQPDVSKEVQSMDIIALSADHVTLLYIVLISDHVGQTRAVQARRAEVVLGLDRALAPAGTGNDAAVQELAVFRAGRRLVQHGPLRPAGRLRRGDLPSVPREDFDMVRCIGTIVEAQARHAASFDRRGILVRDRHVLFLSTAAPLADMETIEQLEDLCEQANVAWVLFGDDTGLMSDDFARAGVLVLQEHSDVVRELVTRAFTKRDGSDHNGTAAAGKPEPAGETGDGPPDATGDLPPRAAGVGPIH